MRLTMFSLTAAFPCLTGITACGCCERRTDRMLWASRIWSRITLSHQPPNLSSIRRPSEEQHELCSGHPQGEVSR